MKVTHSQLRKPVFRSSKRSALRRHRTFSIALQLHSSSAVSRLSSVDLRFTSAWIHYWVSSSSIGTFLTAQAVPCKLNGYLVNELIAFVERVRMQAAGENP